LDPLSNFYPCKFKYKGKIYKSTEHAYQITKANFLQEPHVAYKIQGTHTARQAKLESKPLKTHTNISQWYNIEVDVMKDILQEKAQQIDLFRSELLNTGNCRLTHNLPDKFWGSSFQNNNGKRFHGKNVFAKLLMQLRDTLMPDSHQDSQVPPQHPTNTTAIHTPTLPTHNRFTPLNILSQTEYPPLPPPKHRKPPHIPAISGHHMTKHPNDKPNWHIPATDTKTLIVGDSNLARIDQISNQAHPIELHSFPGLKFFSLHTLFTEVKEPQDSVKTLILSVGINGRDTKIHNNQTNLQRVISSAKKAYPNAQIYIPQINFSDKFQQKQKNNLKAINSTLMEFAGLASYFEYFGTIPTLTHNQFHTATDDIVHWTPNTANAIVSHWLNYLN